MGVPFWRGQSRLLVQKPAAHQLALHIVARASPRADRSFSRWRTCESLRLARSRTRGTYHSRAGVRAERLGLRSRGRVRAE